jgi:aminopeptidase N
MRALPLLLLELCLAVDSRAQISEFTAGLAERGPGPVVPEHYVVTLKPDPIQRRVEGAEAIEVVIQSETKRFILDWSGEKVWNVRLANRTSVQTLQTDYSPAREELAISSRTPLEPGHYTLSLSFRAVMTDGESGLAVHSYPTANGPEQFWAAIPQRDEARHLFPCWDQPSVRATFQLSVQVDSSEQVFSNTPVDSETGFGETGKSVTFQTTPPIPSYLLSLVSGRFDWLEGEADGVRLRVVTLKDKKNLATFALESAKQILTACDGYLRAPLKAVQIDLIALPRSPGLFTCGFGTVLLDENSVVFDSENNAISNQQTIFSCLAAGLALQWFSGQVSWSSWQDQWLSDGLALSMESQLLQQLHPEWDLQPNEADKEAALQQDALNGAEPLSYSSSYPWRPNYGKAVAVIGMIRQFVGETTFRAGLHEFLVNYELQSRASRDLWLTLEHRSNRPVTRLAESWSSQAGFPLIRVTAECRKEVRILTVEQSRFTLDPASVPNQQWIVPVEILSTDDLHDPKYALLDSLTNTFEFPNGRGALDANAGANGFYRVWYEPDLFNQLTKAFHLLTERERADLLNDSWAMAVSNRSPVSEYFGLFPRLPIEPAYAIWHPLLEQLLLIDRLEAGEPERETFETFARAQLNPLMQRLGWDGSTSETLSIRSLRSELIKVLGRFGDRAIIDEAFQRFEAFLSDPDNLSPELREPTLEVVGRYASPTVFEDLEKLTEKTTNLSVQQQLRNAMASALDPSLAEKTLDSVLALPGLDSLEMLRRVLEAGEHADLAWRWVVAHRRTLEAEEPVLLWTQILPMIASHLSDSASADQLRELSQGNPNVNIARVTADLADQIRFRMQLKARLLPDIQNWIQKESPHPQTLSESVNEE